MCAFFVRVCAHAIARYCVCMCVCVRVCVCIYVYVERVNTIRVTEKGNVLGVKRERLVSQFLGKTWKKKMKHA